MNGSFRNSGSDWIHRPTRLAVYARDGWKCVACGRECEMVAAAGLSLDHFVPRSEGGSNAPSNLITLCIPCNSTRGKRPLHFLARAIDIPEVGFMRRVRLALRKKIDRVLGRELCEVVWPGWMAKQAARRRPTSFNFGANAA